ncbi:MAG: ATP-binding cassette domain-containing protein, partial [Clostridia bacterium]|nr:ATP-binding cassette domain-containing protein [Clostridia bacterium]
MAMLEVKDLQVSYGMIQAIKGVSFEVNQGEVIALIGANGAGKTTILHTVTGLLAPKAG